MRPFQAGRWVRWKTLAAVRRSPRAWQAVQSLALAVSVAGVAVLAIELARWHPHPERVSAGPSASSAFHAAAPNLAHDQLLIAVAPEPPEANAHPVASTPTGSGLGSGSAALPSAVLSGAADAMPFKSASELFAEANQARVRGDRATAFARSRQIEAIFPNSVEGITTHLSLGVLYLEQGEPSLALEEFKIYRHIGAIEMMAEALWGEEQAYQKLGRANDERPVLEELLHNFPHSAYAAAAAERLAALNQAR